MNSKKILTSMAAALVSAAALAQAPAFPGAEGHGRYVTGGRGGKVIHVTNLNDKGTGSFRAAVTGNSKKIIVFDVAGVIPLASDLTIGSNTTILGQTAPSPGITLRYYTVRPEDNCIIRFIRLPARYISSVTFCARKGRGLCQSSSTHQCCCHAC